MPIAVFGDQDSNKRVSMVKAMATSSAPMTAKRRHVVRCWRAASLSPARGSLFSCLFIGFPPVPHTAAVAQPTGSLGGPPGRQRTGHCRSKGVIESPPSRDWRQ
jgi:hypothetical protein